MIKLGPKFYREMLLKLRSNKITLMELMRVGNVQVSVVLYFQMDNITEAHGLKICGMGRALAYWLMEEHMLAIG